MIPKVKYYGPQLPTEYAVRVTSAAPNGITVADDSDIDMATNNFGIALKRKLADWTPAVDTILLHKHDGTNGIIVTLLTTGIIRLTINLTNYDASVATGLAANANEWVVLSVVRESASVAGSVTRYIAGSVLGTASAITAGTPATVSNASALYIDGDSGEGFDIDDAGTILLNFAPTASEVLDLCTNGIPASWKWGSQTALSLETNFETGSLVGSGLLSGAGGTYAINSTSPISGVYDGKFVYSSGSSSIYITTTNIPVSTTKTYRLSFDVKGSKSGLTIGRVQARTNTTGAASGGSQNLTGSASITTTTSRASFTFIPSIAIQSFRLDTLSGFSAADEFQIDNIQVVQIGATFAALPETIPTSSATTWSDSSGNTGGGTLPAAGATKVTIRR